MGGAIISCVCSPEREQGRVLAAVNCWDIIADKQPMAHPVVSQVPITRGDNFGLSPQSMRTPDALLCMQIKSYLPFSNSNPQSQPTDIIMNAIARNRMK